LRDVSSLMASIINRRDFLLYGGATLAGVTLGETGRRWLARADERSGAWHPPAAETWAVSVCRECPAACGVRVRMMDRVPVKLEGNPLCPIARGRLCAKGQAALESYFDPDRLVGPARRNGPRGANRWTRISWTEAIDEFAAQIGRARASSGAIVAFGAAEHGPIDDACSKFWSALPAQTAWVTPPTAERLAPRFAALTGASGDPIFDLEHAT
jgi:anaerobic selenocysteine-containing dehydrogenase